MIRTESTRRAAGFSLLDLMVVMVVIAAMLAIQLPTDAASRRTARRMQNSTQLRGIHQGLVTFANSNRNYFAGLNSKGQIIADGQNETGNSGDGDTVQARFWIMIRGDFFTPEYMISPSETAEVEVLEYEWHNNQPPGAVKWDQRTKHYSYAMLDIAGDPGKTPDAKGRGFEWAQTLNSQAIVLSDRNSGDNATHRVRSIHTDEYGEWRGSALWNDNHVAFEAGQYFQTKYGPAELFRKASDNLFSSEKTPDGQSGYDALMLIANDNIAHGGE